eukprot:3519522-Amphidinium_carterae.1
MPWLVTPRAGKVYGASSTCPNALAPVSVSCIHRLAALAAKHAMPCGKVTHDYDDDNKDDDNDAEQEDDDVEEEDENEEEEDDDDEDDDDNDDGVESNVYDV